MRDKPRQIRTDAASLSESEHIASAHLYLAYGPFPGEALCGWRLYDEDGEGGNPPDEDGDSMVARHVKSDWNSLGHMFRGCAVCHDCKIALADHLGYDSVGEMLTKHANRAERMRE